MRGKRGGGANLGTEAVAEGTNLGEALVLEVLEGELDDGVDGFLGVGVLAVGALGQPLHEVEVGGAVEGEGVLVEEVGDDGVVAVGGELVGHQLAVLPDADDVRQVQQGDAVVLVAALGLGHVHVVLADLDRLALGLAVMLDADGAALRGGVGGHDMGGNVGSGNGEMEVVLR